LRHDIPKEDSRGEIVHMAPREASGEYKDEANSDHPRSHQTHDKQCLESLFKSLRSQRRGREEGERGREGEEGERGGGRREEGVRLVG
jgi:hypothetical protein